jgi:hypothetical protein
MNALAFFFFFLCLFYTQLRSSKQLAMSSHLTPFQATQRRSELSLPGLYDATPSLEDTTPTSTGFGSRLNTPSYDYTLLSPPDFVSPSNNTFRALDGSMGHETSAYKRLMQRYILTENELSKEKEGHHMLR